MTETRTRYKAGRGALRVVPSNPPTDIEGADDIADIADIAAAEEAETHIPTPSGPLEQSIMYAVLSWLALCVERVAVAVEIQPIAERLYEVSAHFDEEHTQGIILRVKLEVLTGLVVRSTVEPVRPS